MSKSDIIKLLFFFGLSSVLLLTIFMLIDSAKAEGGLTLVWDTPTTREDGSQLDPSDIKGYRIYAKTTAEYQLLAEIDNVNEFPLTFGHGCVKMATIDIAGISSVLSKEYCFNAPLPPDNYRLEINLKWITPSNNP